MFMFVLNILCHNLQGTNRPEGWVRTDRKWVRNVCAWVRKIPGYETTGKRKWGFCSTAWLSKQGFIWSN